MGEYEEFMAEAKAAAGAIKKPPIRVTISQFVHYQLLELDPRLRHWVLQLTVSQHSRRHGTVIGLCAGAHEDGKQVRNVTGLASF